MLERPRSTPGGLVVLGRRRCRCWSRGGMRYHLAHFRRRRGRADGEVAISGFGMGFSRCFRGLMFTSHCMSRSTNFASADCRRPLSLHLSITARRPRSYCFSAQLRSAVSLSTFLLLSAPPPPSLYSQEYSPTLADVVAWDVAEAVGPTRADTSAMARGPRSARTMLTRARGSGAVVVRSSWMLSEVRAQ